MSRTIKVRLPTHLRTLARISERQIDLDIAGGPTDVVTMAAVIDALEARYPALRGTIRDQVTHKRRAFVRFFACEEDLSHDPADQPLPEPVAAGTEPLLIVGAMAGG
ncbi:MoaD/ThiS family protein [Saccharomonospora sp. NPDC006951]